MTIPSIEVTYRSGHAIAAYIQLDERSRAACRSTREAAPGLVVDFAGNGRAIGLEVVSPRTATLAAVNRVLRAVGATPLRRIDFAPLRVA